MMSLPIQVLGRREREVISEMPAVMIPAQNGERPRTDCPILSSSGGMLNASQPWRSSGFA
jgi:hypothetical protein